MPRTCPSCGATVPGNTCDNPLCRNYGKSPSHIAGNTPTCPDCSVDLLQGRHHFGFCPKCGRKINIDGRCPDCAGSRLVPNGQKSLLDGMEGWNCEDCGSSLSPRRSRRSLWIGMLIAGLIVIFCCAVGYAMVKQDARSPFGLDNLVFLGPVVGVIVILRLCLCLSEKTPITSQECETTRTDER